MPSDVNLSFRHKATRTIPRRTRDDTFSSPRPEADESQDDAAATGGNSAFNMNQSIFQMITAAGSKTDFNTRYESSDSEDTDHDDSHANPPNVLRSVAMLKKPSNFRFREKRMLQSTPHLQGMRAKLQPHVEQDADTDEESETSITSSPISAALGASIAKDESGSIKHEDEVEEDLAIKLKEIFGFLEPERVISEYPCWLLKSALLRGYMYITIRHVCFYAYLPKRENMVIKSGHLSKRGHSNPKYKRYWFKLKGDVFSYYEDPGKIYFPRGNIDLRYGVQAAERSRHFFTLTTTEKVIHFRADSAASAKDWVNKLNKIILRSHNEGDGVKIALPIESIYGLEEIPVLEYADTIKLDVLDQIEHTTDEYFFSFFDFGKEVFQLLKKLTEESAAHTLRPPSGASVETSISHSPPVPLEKIKTTLKCNSRPTSPASTITHSTSLHHNPFRSPRHSGEYSRSGLEIIHRSVDTGKGTLEQGKHISGASRSIRSSGSRPLSGESFVESISKDSSFAESDSYQLASGEETASQILSGSAIFQNPTLRKSWRDPRDMPKKDGDSAASLIHAPSKAHKSTLCHSRPETPGKVDGEKETHTLSGVPNIAKAGQRAAEWADWMKKRSKEMASRPRDYIEKVSDMWSGGKKHYGPPLGAMPDEKIEDGEEDDGTMGPEERYRDKFALHPSERLRAAYFGYLNRGIPLYGKLYLGNRHLCYRSLVPGTRTKMILPLKDIENVSKEGGFRFGYSGLVVTIRGHEELFFEFGYQSVRDDCWMHLLQEVEVTRMRGSIALLGKEQEEAEAAKREYQALENARHAGHAEHDLQLPTSVDDSDGLPILFDDLNTSLITFKPPKPLRITCLTIGSRGDVQPYIALCRGLIKEGHIPRIATHAEFQPWVESHGIEFARVEGDPAELMRICVENGMFTYSFLKEATSKFRGWLDELLASAWVACQDSDVLIESPSAMAGIHIAEALRIPYFRAFTMPWTRTRAYPHAFAVPDRKMGGPYNYFTYVMFDNVFWNAIAGQINRWRKKTLDLPRTNLDKLQPDQVPFLYNFSPSVVTPPKDYGDWIKVTGYWFLDENSRWEAPKELLDFINRARLDGKRLVYVGFGSIVVSDPHALTRTVVESVLKADVRCILSKGWSDRLGSKNQTELEFLMPPEIHIIKSAPHDWLFRQIDAAAHHGGAGTTGASLRAGIPTIIKPFFGDQFFFGSRVEDLGVGVCIKKLNVNAFSKALRDATRDGRMIEKAKVLGEQIRKENGVETAIQTIYRDIDYAKSLIEMRAHVGDYDSHEHTEEQPADNVEDSDSWTFVGDELDVDSTKN
ncbi:hypothetical protein BDZ91DRAFT_818398 [Kalaharituber pfeilii]|nr:hypothetical protein BDZ91DRAFT_818398 [Kalaharituber pfeilii]